MPYEKFWVIRVKGKSVKKISQEITLFSSISFNLSHVGLPKGGKFKLRINRYLSCDINMRMEFTMEDKLTVTSCVDRLFNGGQNDSAEEE